MSLLGDALRLFSVYFFQTIKSPHKAGVLSAVIIVIELLFCYNLTQAVSLILLLLSASLED